jgi:hypothetical protein
MESGALVVWQVARGRVRKWAGHPQAGLWQARRGVRPLLADKLRPLNEHRLSPESTLTLARYAKDFFLPHIECECKPSTAAGYKGLWHTYLAGQREVQTRLRDFRCVDATNLLADVHRKHRLGRTTLKHIKSFLSRMFTYAKRQGVMDGMNPVRDAGIPRSASAPEETYAASADEVLTILDVLERAKEFQARALVEQGGKTTTVRNSRSSNRFGARIRPTPKRLVPLSPCRSSKRCGQSSQN